MSLRHLALRGRLRGRLQRPGLRRYDRHHASRQRGQDHAGALGPDRQGLQRGASGREGRVQISRERGVQGQAADHAAGGRVAARACSTAGAAASWRRRPRPASSRTSPPTSPPSRPNLSPTAVDAFKVDGKAVGVPFEVGRRLLLLQQEAVREGGREGRGHQELGRFARRGEDAQGRRHHADRRSAPARNGRCTSTIPIS